MYKTSPVVSNKDSSV